MFDEFTLTDVTDTGHKKKYSFFQETSDECPVRLEETMDATNQVLAQKKMAADRIVVQLNSEVHSTPSVFLQDLAEALLKKNIKIHLNILKWGDAHHQYLLQFPYSPEQPELYSLIFNAAKKLAVSVSPYSLAPTHPSVIGSLEKETICTESNMQKSADENTVSNVDVKLGYQARDNQKFETAIQIFKNSHSFEGAYAIAELYHFGTNDLTIKKDLLKATAFYLDAYTYHQDRFIIEVNGMPPIPSLLPQTLAESNELLRQAHELNPDALYLLAMFYKNEEKEPSTARVISASTEELSERILGCLKASADLYHPHSAYVLSTEYGEKLSIEEKLKYSRIAADPETARTTVITSASTYSFRGTYPVTTELKLSQGQDFPISLCKQRNIGHNTNLKNLFQQNEYTFSGSILPTVHKSYDKTLINTLGEGTKKPAFTKDEVRKIRLERFMLSSPAETSSVKQPLPPVTTTTHTSEDQRVASNATPTAEIVSPAMTLPTNSSSIKAGSSNTHKTVHWSLPQKSETAIAPTTIALPTQSSLTDNASDAHKNIIWNQQQTRETTILEAFIKKHHIELPGSIEDVPHDGNCFFHAVSRQLKKLNLDKISHIDLRLKAIGYILECRDEFEQYFCTEDNSKRETESLDDYVVRMSNSGTIGTPGAWADGPIIMAIARQYNIHICVYEIRETGDYFPHHHHDEEGISKPTIALVLYHQRHYYILHVNQHTHKITHDNLPIIDTSEKLQFTAATLFSLIEDSKNYSAELQRDAHDKAKKIDNSISIFDDPHMNFDRIIDQSKKDLRSNQEKTIAAARATLLQIAACFIWKASKQHHQALELLDRIGKLYYEALNLEKEIKNRPQSNKIKQLAEHLFLEYNVILKSRDDDYNTYVELYKTGLEMTSDNTLRVEKVAQASADESTDPSSTSFSLN